MEARFGHSKRAKVLEKTDGHCAYCGTELPPLDAWHTEHVVPRSKGGSSELDNLVAACGECNSRKKTKEPHEFQMWLVSRIDDSLQEAQQRLLILRKYQTAAGETNTIEKYNTIEKLLALPDEFWPRFYHDGFPEWDWYEDRPMQEGEDNGQV